MYNLGECQVVFYILFIPRWKVTHTRLTLFDMEFIECESQNSFFLTTMDNSVCNSFLYHLILQKTSNEIQVTTVLFSTRMKRYIFDLNIEFQCYQTNVRPLNSQLNKFCINIRSRLIYFNEWKLMYWKCEVTWPPLRDSIQN